MKANDSPNYDVLQAARDLFATISGAKSLDDPNGQLCLALDTYVYASRFLDSETIDQIESVDVDIEEVDELEIRAEITNRFPGLGYYWQALNSRIEPDENGELAVGDAIDDLLDISKELNEVLTIEKVYGREEALAALRFRHEHHLHMHLFPLRLYLEESRRDA